MNGLHVKYQGSTKRKLVTADKSKYKKIKIG